MPPFATLCDGCSFLIEFEIPDEEVGAQIAFECPRCNRRGHAPGVTPEQFAMAVWEMNKTLAHHEGMTKSIHDWERAAAADEIPEPEHEGPIVLGRFARWRRRRRSGR